MKKITTLILAIVMIVSAFAVWAFAAEEENWNVDLTDGIFLNLYSGKTLVGTEEVAAKEMGVVKTIGTKSSSVAEYANGLINDQKTYNRTQIKLAQALLNYGAAAKAYWNYADGEITNGTPVTDYSALISAEYPAAVYEGANNYIGATLTLDAKMKLRLYFKSGAVLRDQNGAEFTYYTHPTNGYIYIEEPITPKEIFKTFTYTCDGAIVSYSPVNYLKNVVMSEDASAELKNLVASIYAYGLVAEDYRAGGLIQLDHLQRTDIDTHEYDMSKLEEVAATVAYNSGSASNDNYYVYNDGETISYIIEVTDTTFDSLSVELADGEYLRFAFLAEAPVMDQPVKYAEGYCTYKAAWTFDFTVDIPADAKYFIMAKYDDGTDVTPKSMTFTKNTTVLENLQNATTDTYSYPIQNLVFDHGVINDVSVEGNKWFDGFEAHAFCNNEDCKVAIIDITGCEYDYVSLSQDLTFAKQLGWTFLKELPERRQPVSYATGYCIDEKNGFKWGNSNIDKDGNSHTAYDIEIPEDANYLVLYYMESYYSEGDSYDNDWRYYPNSITFSKNPTNDPLTRLQNATDDYYSYPIDQIESAGGCIIYWAGSGNANKFYTNYNGKGEGYYLNAFIDITGVNYEYLTLISSGTKNVGWAFLTDIPEEGEKASYATGYSTFLWGDDLPATNIEIPEDANYLALYHTEGSGNYVPTSITFTKDPIDAIFAVRNEKFYFTYPKDQIVSAGGAIIYWDETEGEGEDEVILEAGGNRFLTNFYNNGEGKYQNAFIDISGLTAEGLRYITIAANGNKKAGWAFVSEIPEEGEVAKYVGAQGFSWTSSTTATTKNISIPSGAKYLVIYYEEAGNSYIPASIVFHRSKK